MSHEANDMMADTIRDGVADIWMLPNRPDLEEDCIEFIWDRWDKEIPYQDEVYINFLLIQFLSGHCQHAISSSDITHMEIMEKARLLELDV